MSNLSRSPTDRNSGRNYVRFRVFSQNKGECQQEFAIKLKDITWDNFLRYLFGSHTFERHQPTIILLGDKHKIVLRNTNIKQLIRDCLTETFKGSCVNLLVPDFDKYFLPSTSTPGQITSNDDEIKRKKAEVKDFTEIFSKRMDLPTMDHFVQSVPHVRFMREERDDAARVELPASENTTQLGELQVKLLNDGDLANLLKDGATLILPTAENRIVSVKFSNDQLPTFNETRCKYRNLNLAYECSDLKIPVLLDDDIKFLFNRDAEFVQKMVKTLEAAEQKQKEHIIRLKKFQETMKKIKTVKETSTESAPSTSSATIPAASAPVPAPAAEAPAPTTQTTAAPTPAPAPADPVIPPTSEGSSNEGAQTASRVYRRPHRSAQKRTKRCLAAAAGVLSSAGRLVSSVENQCGYSPSNYNRDRDSIVAALQDLSLVSGSQSRCPVLAAPSYYPRTQFTVNPGPSTAATDAQQEATSDPPAWFGDLLNKFKSEVLQEVKSMVKDVLDTSLPAQPANDLKTSLELNQDDEQYHYKALDGSSPVGKHKHHDKQHHSNGSSSKRKSASCSKRSGGAVPGNAENKTATPFTFSERILEISNSLFVYSKSGYKVRMPQNASLTIQIRVGKMAKYRNSLEDIDLRVQSVSNSIECCVKRAAPVSAASKTAPTFTFNNMDPPINYDVRIKSKDKSGKFRLYFNVIAGGRIIGHSFKIDVRVKKEYTLPFNGSEGTLNDDNELLAAPLPREVLSVALPESNPMPSTSSALNFAETQKSSAQQSGSEISEAVAAAAAAVVELADEGIGGNQEDFFSPTSDSEYSDVSDSKPDALPKDEGIDTCYRSMVDSENSGALQCVPLPDLDSDSDTDSSISFLIDEHEARDEMNDSLDVVQLPSCFIPNAELTDDVLPVRIKRKNSSVNKRNSANETGSGDLLASEQPQQQQQQQNFKPTAFDASTATSVSAAPVQTPSTAAPVVTISDDDEDNEDVSFLNESIKSAAVDHAYHRSLYPNLQGLKESVRPATSGTETCAAPAPAATASNATESAKQQQAGASSPSTEPYPNILPEKLFEMWKNAVPLPKQMHETVSSVFSSVSNEINNAASAARAAAANAAAAAANIVPNVPTPPSPTAPSLLNELQDKAQKYAYEAAAAAAAAKMPPPSSFATGSSIWSDLDNATNYARAAAASFVPNPTAWTTKPEDILNAGGATPSAPSAGAESQTCTSDAQNRSSHSQPPEEKRQKNVSFSFESQQQPQPEQQTDQSSNSAHINSMYKNISEQMQSDLITLHDMGFTDDPYMIYLLEQFPNDLGKVIESLINYSTY